MDLLTRDPAVFFEACAAGDVDTMRRLLENDPNLTEQRHDDAVGGTGLHPAAKRGHVEAVRMLLEHGADPNARDNRDNASPLHSAAGGGHLDTVRALLDAGADVHGDGQSTLDKEEITDKPVTTIINTHTHFEQVGGNVEFPAAVEVIAGTSSTSGDFGPRAVVWDQGTTPELGEVSGAEHGFARGINDNGQMGSADETVTRRGHSAFCDTLEAAVTLNHHASAGIITPIGIIGAGIRVGRGRVM